MKENLSRYLAKVGDVAVSTDESVVLELITSIKASVLSYSNQNKRLSLRKREAGCSFEAKI